MNLQNRLILISIGVLLLIAAATVVPAQRPKLGTVRDATKPDSMDKQKREGQVSDNTRVQVETAPEPNAIRIHVHYPTEFGYREISSSTMWPFSCDAFSVNAVRLRRPRSAGESQNEVLMTVVHHPRMRLESGQYICDFTISSAPLNEPIKVQVSMANGDGLTEAWQAGSNPQPPSGSERLILHNSREVALTADQPTSILEFEMAYGSHARRQP